MGHHERNNIYLRGRYWTLLFASHRLRSSRFCWRFCSTSISSLEAVLLSIASLRSLPGARAARLSLLPSREHCRLLLASPCLSLPTAFSYPSLCSFARAVRQYRSQLLAVCIRLTVGLKQPQSRYKAHWESGQSSTLKTENFYATPLPRARRMRIIGCEPSSGGIEAIRATDICVVEREQPH